MKKFLYLSSVSFLVVTLALNVQASQTDPVRNIKSYALDKEEAGYVPEYDAGPVIANYAHLVHANYTDALEDAQRLQQAIAGLLKDPSQATLNSAKNAWINARASYLQTEAFRFYEGPIDFADEKTGEEGPEGRLNAWPLNEGFIDYVKGNEKSGLVNDLSFEITAENIREKDQVEDEADATTGYHAIEFLLWGQDMDPTSPGHRPWEDYVAGKGNNDRRRLYLETVTDMLVDDLLYLAIAWTPRDEDSYAATFQSMEDKDALGRMLTSLATLGEFELAIERLATGLDSGDQEDEQSCFSDNTLNDFIYDQRGIRNVYFGTYGKVQGPGLNTLVASLAPALDEKMVSALNRTESALSRLGYPYDATLVSAADSPERAAAENLIIALQAQTDVLKEIGKLLGVKVVVPTGN